MKKRAISLLLISVMLISILIVPIFAEDNETIDLTGADKAYSCLKSQLGNDCGETKSTEQTAFSLLAMAYDSGIQSDCKSSLIDKEKDNCWGASSSSNCDLKSTSQAVLALNNIGINTDDYTDWLLEQRKLTKDLDWFLEIDANEATICKIKTDNANEKTFTINEDKKFDTKETTYLKTAEQNYYLKIKEAGLNKNFTISCDKDFITTLLYKKPGDSVYYVSSKTHSSASDGTTEEKVESYCFTTSGACDYEGTLWTALALAKTGQEITSYIPYLSSIYDETTNKKYFPSAFLYMITDQDDYYIDVTEKQKQGEYWEENNKYYDTALALLSLQNLALEEVDNAKDYLLGIQDSSGCWNSNNIRDTAFILYAWEQKTPASVEGISKSDCVDFGHYCVSASKCSSSDTLDNFYCSGSDVCCASEPLSQTCEEKNGIICESNQECTGSEVTAFDTNYCCLASCIETSSTTECEDYGYFCKTSCSSDEQEKTGYSCNFGDVCCAPKPEKSTSWLWIVLLIILIILVILAIIFRNQVKIWWFRFKSKLKFGKPPKSPSGRPTMPPSATPFFQKPRQIIPRQSYPVRRRTIPQKRTQKDSVFEETMKKLKDMAK